MSQVHYEALATRLARLEVENRRMKWIGVASLCAASLLALAGARGPGDDGVLKRERLILTNKEGSSTITMGASPKGLPAITLNRRVGEETYFMRQELYVADDGTPILIFVDQSGTRRYKIPR